MVTTGGAETNFESLLEDLIQLDYDAADAYEAAINRLQEARFRDRLREFRGDHLRHIMNSASCFARWAARRHSKAT